MAVGNHIEGGKSIKLYDNPITDIDSLSPFRQLRNWITGDTKPHAPILFPKDRKLQRLYADFYHAYQPCKEAKGKLGRLEQPLLHMFDNFWKDYSPVSGE